MNVSAINFWSMVKFMVAAAALLAVSNGSLVYVLHSGDASQISDN